MINLIVRTNKRTKPKPSFNLKKKKTLLHPHTLLHAQHRLNSPPWAEAIKIFSIHRLFSKRLIPTGFIVRLPSSIRIWLLEHTALKHTIRHDYFPTRI